MEEAAFAYHRALASLRARPDVIEVEPFGASLHVRTNEKVDEAILRSWLDPSAAISRVVEIRPSLEDVFLAVAARGAA